MEFLRDLGFTWSEIADAAMVSTVTLWRHFKDLGLSTVGYTDMSDTEQSYCRVVVYTTKELRGCGYISVCMS